MLFRSEKMLIELDTWLIKHDDAEKLYSDYITDKSKIREDEIRLDNIRKDKKVSFIK